MKIKGQSVLAAAAALLVSLALLGAEVASSQPHMFTLDTATTGANVDGALLFDFETEEEREAVRKWNPGYGSLISVTNAFAASGDFALRAVGMGDTDDAATGYLPRLMLRPAVTDWRDYDRLVVEVTSLGDSGANGRLRLFLAGPDGSYVNSVWLQLPLKNRGYRQWVVPLQWEWEGRLGNIARLFFSFEEFPNGCDVCIDRIMLLRKGSDVPSASTAFIERVAMPFIVAARDELSATNEVLAAELAHLRDYVRFCGKASRSAFRSHRMAVGMATSMEKVRPRAEVTAHAIPGEGLSLRLARNEYESVQVVVAALGEDLKGVKVAVDGDLTPMQNPECRMQNGKRGDLNGLTAQSLNIFAATNVACEVMGYVNVTAASKCASGYNVKVSEEPGYTRRTKKAEKGWWPDPILSFTNAVDVSGTDVQGFWVRVHCPEGQAAGLYRGSLLVSAEGVEPVRIPFSVRVNDFSLGRVSELPLMVDCQPVPHGNWRTADIPDSPLNLWGQHAGEWGDFLADYLISWNNIYGDEEVHFDILERLRSQGRLGPRFCIGYVWAPASPNDADVTAWRASSEKVFARMGKAYDEAKARGLLDRACIYGWDERPENEFPQIRLAVAELKSRFPGVPISTTARDLTYGTALTNVDWFIPNAWEYRQKLAEKSRRAGHQVWWYTCDGPRAPYANWFIECQAIETRLLMGAMAQRMKPNGFLNYRINMWRSERCIESGPFTDWLVEVLQENAANGDGYLTYVGHDGIPLPSIRLENFRDGLEDYAYAKLLERKLREMQNAQCTMHNEAGGSPSPATESTAVDCNRQPTAENQLAAGEPPAPRPLNPLTAQPLNRASWARRAQDALAVPRSVMDTMTNYTDDPAALYRWRDEMADLIEEAEHLTQPSTPPPQRKDN